MLQPDARIAIFVDSIDEKKRRYCYWTRYLASQGVLPTYVSIAELAHEADAVFSDQDDDDAAIEEVKRKQPRLDGYDVIILNWDVANGDFVFGADKALGYFETRGRDEIRRWARNGSRIIIEIQATAGFPSQPCYDAILGKDDVRVTPYGRTRSFEDTENKLMLNRRRKAHPLIREIWGHCDHIESSYTPFPHVVFPRFDKKNDSSFARNPSYLSWGGFVGWSGDWIPLFLRSRRFWRRDAGLFERLQDAFHGQPVALAKAVGGRGGEVIVTTARIANAATDDVIDAFVDFGDEQRRRTRRFYLRAKVYKVARRTAIIVAIWVIGVLAVISLATAAADQVNGWVTGVIAGAASAPIIEAMPPVASFATEYGSRVKLVDVAGIALMLTFVGLSARVWRKRNNV